MKPRQAGFTLIEVMVSIGILSMITLMLWASSQGAFRTKKSVEAKMSRYRVARLAMDRILRDVQMAYLSNKQHSRHRADAAHVF
jgi:general secretion pathway protein J